MSALNEAKPNINVTPLIDVLLVLLIIFMVIAPLKPTDFKAKLPSESKNDNAPPDPKTLVVTINPDNSLALNGEKELGTIGEPGALIARLTETFKTRTENRVYADELVTRTDLSDEAKIQKTVFIKAPRSVPYGEVVKVVDAINGAGANPIGLQIDGLPR